MKKGKGHILVYRKAMHTHIYKNIGYTSKIKSDIRRLNSRNVVAFFASIERLFHKADALYLKLRFRKFVLGFGNFKSVSKSRKS